MVMTPSFWPKQVSASNSKSNSRESVSSSTMVWLSKQLEGRAVCVTCRVKESGRKPTAKKNESVIEGFGPDQSKTKSPGLTISNLAVAETKPSLVPKHRGST